MTAAGRVVKQTYPRLFHIISVDLSLHNAAERIHANYEDVDKLIAAVKASMVKNKEGTRQLVVKAKEAVAAESLPRSLR